MIILYPDRISSITALSYDADYPVANMLDDHPQKPWKAAAGMGTPTPTTSGITVITDGGAVSGIGIFGTNVTSGTVAVKNALETITYETHSISGTLGRFFVQFGIEYNAVMHIVVALSAPAGSYAGELYIGVVRCGSLISIPNPKTSGVNFGRDDYSVRHELSNGGLYVAKRNTPRKFELSFAMLQTEFDDIDAVFDANGSNPLPMLIAEDMDDDNKWCGFFHIAEPPTADYAYQRHTNCTMVLKEAV